MKNDLHKKIAIWYARISTNEDIQKHSLRAQCEDIEKYCNLYWLNLKKIEKEQASWTKMIKRKKLQKILEEKSFDILITTKIDRLARNIVDLNKIVYLLKENWKDLVFIENNIDTTSANWRLFLNILWSFAEFEAEIISERVKRWMQQAKKKWIKLGRKPKKQTILKTEIQKIRTLRQRKAYTFSKIAKELWYRNWSVIRNKLNNYKKTLDHKISQTKKIAKIRATFEKRKLNWLNIWRPISKK